MLGSPAPLKADQPADAKLPSLAETQTFVDDIVDTMVHGLFKMNDLQEEISEYLEENAADNENWSVEILDPSTGESISWNADEMQTAASTIKLFVVGAVLENMEQCTEMVKEEVILSLISSVLKISDNEAATELITILGQGNTTEGKDLVNAYCEEHGFDNTYLGILFTGVDPTGTVNGTCSQDTTSFLAMVLDGELPGSDIILENMLASERTNKIPASLPSSVKTANKTGELNTTENDCAIVYGRQSPYILSIMIDSTDPSKAVLNIRDISEMAYESLGQ